MFRRMWKNLTAPTMNDERNPNWCFTHGTMYPACAGMH